MRVGTKVEFPNFDDTYHDVFSFSPVKRSDLGRFRPDAKPVPSETVDTAALVTPRCDIHEHMRALILVRDTPYFALRDHRRAHGGFRAGGRQRRVCRGVWIDGTLHLASLGERTRAALAAQINPLIAAPGGPERRLAVQVDGAPYLAFSKALNPWSAFPPAYEVCLYPLADSLAAQRRLRWQIVGTGPLVLVVESAAPVRGMSALLGAQGTLRCSAHAASSSPKSDPMLQLGNKFTEP